nr:MAG TPA: hypothetical protein [Caudoviricetes sp.]
MGSGLGRKRRGQYSQTTSAPFVRHIQQAELKVITAQTAGQKWMRRIKQ